MYSCFHLITLPLLISPSAESKNHISFCANSEAAHQLGVREVTIENELPLGGIADLRSDTTGQANEVWKTGKIIANLS